MFPHTITVYRYQDDDSYSRTVIRGVYWYGSRSQAKSDKGVDQEAAVTVIIPFLDVDVQPGDLIVKSEWKTIRSKMCIRDRIKALKSRLRPMTIARMRCAIS